MEYEWDEAKNTVNRRKHRVGFDAMAGFDWNFATREWHFEEGEERELVIGPIGDSLYAAVIVERERTRVVSLRPATQRERRNWRREFHG